MNRLYSQKEGANMNQPVDLELYIRLENGQPVDHPILGSNLRSSNINTGKLPSNYVRFIRYSMPDVGPYEVVEGCTYEWDGAVVRDVWQVRQMTEEEKTNKINSAKEAWSKTGWISWTFNEEKCLYEPPVPMPGPQYKWMELGGTGTGYWQEGSLNGYVIKE